MTGSAAASDSRPTDGVGLRNLILCSLEAWDEVWRRNQFLVDELLRRNPLLHVLFVEPAADPLFDLRSGRLPALPRFRTLTSDGRLKAFRPLKPAPRRLGAIADRALLAQVRAAVRVLGFHAPVLWMNDVTYAPIIERTGWPSLYDVTDDWLLGPATTRELDRLHRLESIALRDADEVVVCSATLARSRGRERAVAIVPNGVDVRHFQRPRPRPVDLPPSPAAVYVGSLHEARFDVDLVVDLARKVRSLTIALIGPESIELATRRRVADVPNILLLGPRPYDDVPAYLQHADVVVVPHRVTPFTESLDPIKAYECLAIDTPTVATPVAGFREHSDALHVVSPEEFSSRVVDVITRRAPLRQSKDVAAWSQRAAEFETVLRRALLAHNGRASARAKR